MRLNGTLRGESGVHQVVIEAPAGCTVQEALALLVAQNPQVRPVLLDAAGQLRHNLLIFRYGSNVRLLDGMKTTVAADDKLDIFPLTGAQRAFA